MNSQQVINTIQTIVLEVFYLFARPFVLVTRVFFHKEMGERYLDGIQAFLSLILIAGVTAASAYMTGGLVAIVIGSVWTLAFLYCMWRHFFIDVPNRYRNGIRWHSRCSGIPRVDAFSIRVQSAILLGGTIGTAVVGMYGFAALLLMSLWLTFLADMAAAKMFWTQVLDAVDGQIEAEMLGTAVEQRLTPAEASGLKVCVPAYASAEFRTKIAEAMQSNRTQRTGIAQPMPASVALPARHVSSQPAWATDDSEARKPAVNAQATPTPADVAQVRQPVLAAGSRQSFQAVTSTLAQPVQVADDSQVVLPVVNTEGHTNQTGTHVPPRAIPLVHDLKAPQCATSVTSQPVRAGANPPPMQPLANADQQAMPIHADAPAPVQTGPAGGTSQIPQAVAGTPVQEPASLATEAAGTTNPQQQAVPDQGGPTDILDTKELRKYPREMETINHWTAFLPRLATALQDVEWELRNHSPSGLFNPPSKFRLAESLVDFEGQMVSARRLAVKFPSVAKRLHDLEVQKAQLVETEARLKREYPATQPADEGVLLQAGFDQESLLRKVRSDLKAQEEEQTARAAIKYWSDELAALQEALRREDREGVTQVGRHPHALPGQLRHDPELRQFEAEMARVRKQAAKSREIANRLSELNAQKQLILESVAMLQRQ